MNKNVTIKMKKLVRFENKTRLFQLLFINKSCNLSVYHLLLFMMLFF